MRGGHARGRVHDDGDDAPRPQEEGCPQFDKTIVLWTRSGTEISEKQTKRSLMSFFWH